MQTLSNSTSKHLRLVVTLIFLVFPATQSKAANDIPLSEHHFFQDVPVVLSATRLSQQLSDIPAAVTIIDKQMIKASGALEVPEILRLVPGFHVARYIGSKQSATYHGLADEYARDMQVLVDGRSVYDPVFRFNNGIQVSVDGYFLDDITWKGEGDPLPAYRRWDMRVAKDFRFPDIGGEIALVLQNINGSHLEFRDDNKEETGAYLQLELNYR